MRGIGWARGTQQGSDGSSRPVPTPVPLPIADAKEQVLANLANFAYDPGNYQYLRQLQVLDLFLDSLSEENETLIKFAIGKS